MIFFVSGWMKMRVLGNKYISFFMILMIEGRGGFFDVDGRKFIFVIEKKKLYFEFPTDHLLKLQIYILQFIRVLLP